MLITAITHVRCALNMEPKSPAGLRMPDERGSSHHSVLFVSWGKTNAAFTAVGEGKEHREAPWQKLLPELWKRPNTQSQTRMLWVQWHKVTVGPGLSSQGQVSRAATSQLRLKQM